MINENSSKIIKQVLKKALKGILAFIAFLLIYLVVTFVLSWMTVSAEADTKDEIDIYIRTNGVHVDLVMPSNHVKHNWFNNFGHLPNTEDPDDYKYLAIGWGDKGFYLNTPTWAELKASTAIKAVFGLSGSAIHATYYKDMVENDRCKKISISNDQYQRLIQFIESSLVKDTDGGSMKIETNANWGIEDAFYEANGRYSIFNTCNSWANRGLKSAGQRACVWTAFQQGIFAKY